MRMNWRTLMRPGSPQRPDRGLRRDVALVCLADGIIGVSFGATSVAGGLPGWLPVVMSLLIFAGGSQFADLPLLASLGGLAWLWRRR